MVSEVIPTKVSKAMECYLFPTFVKAIISSWDIKGCHGCAIEGLICSIWVVGQGHNIH